MTNVNLESTFAKDLLEICLGSFQYKISIGLQKTVGKNF